MRGALSDGFGTAVGVDSCKRAGYKTHNAGHVCFKLYLLD